MIAVIFAALLQVTPAPSPTAPPPPPPPTQSATPGATPPASPAPSPSATPPTIAAQPSAVNLHPSQSLTVLVTGAAGTLTAAVDTPLVTVNVDQNARTLTLASTQQTGRASLTVTDSSGASILIPVRVAFDAATVPANVTLRVTGDQIQPQWLQQQILKALASAVRAQPGTSVQYGALSVPSILSPGASADVPVAVQVPGGDQFFDVNAIATVNVQNVGTPPFLPPLLFYDDDPEKVVADGVLYRNQVSTQSAARLYYYHQNSGEQRRIAVVLTPQTPSDPATVQIVDASAGPNVDVMSVGHAVSRDFLVQKTHNVGMLVDVGSSPYVADEFLSQPGDGVAGSIGVRVLSGGPVNVTVLSVPPGTTDDQLATYLAQPQLPDDGHHRTGVFTLTGYGTETLAYDVGGPDAFTQYGATTPPAVDGAGHDYGDYGVVRTLQFDVNNAGTQPATVYLYEEPMGGVVRSSFLVNGVLYQVGCARVSQKYQIGDPVTVNPGTSQIVVETMTDGGSNYPLGVGLTSTPPLPQTPAINASDGCFPKPQQATPEASPSPQATPEASPSPRG